MTLLSLAWRNIRRNFYSYFLYFASMVFSIMIYFTFVSIKFNQQVLAIAENKQSVASSFTASSIVLAIFALIFIWYSNSFFTRKRKQEIGLYSLLGIKKRQIGRMLFYENMLMGIIALAAGIFLGSLLSKLFTMLLVNLMGYSVPISFSIIPRAIYGTIKVFSVLFLFISLQAYAIIYRIKLIDLFKAEKAGEKEPTASVLAAILAVVFIGGGYLFYLYVKIDFLISILVTLIAVVIGTFLLFSSLTVLLIKLARRNKKRYYQGVNMISTSNLLYRIKSHARTLALIAVLSATTLTVMSVAASLYYDFKLKMDFVAPFSYVYMSDDQTIYHRLEQEIDQIISHYPEHQLKEEFNFELLRVTADLPTGLNGAYHLQNVYLMQESKYNQLARASGKEGITLKNKADTFFIDEYFNEVFKEAYTGKFINLQPDSKFNQFKVVDFAKTPIMNIGLLKRTMVIKDEVYNRLARGKRIFLGKAFNISNEKQSRALTVELEHLLAGYWSQEDRAWGVWFISFFNYFQRGITNSGQGIFISGFLGLVFLLSTGSIIFFKLLSEANEEKYRYRILRNIGVSKQKIKSLLARQIFYIFAFPLGVGIMHSLVAVSILSKLLSVNLTIPITTTIIAYAAIYMAYYAATVKSYAGLVNK